MTDKNPLPRSEKNGIRYTRARKDQAVTQYLVGP